MERKSFTLTLPIDLCDRVDKKALKTFHKKNARNQMITDILFKHFEEEPNETAQPNGDSHASRADLLTDAV